MRHPGWVVEFCGTSCNSAPHPILQILQGCYHPSWPLPLLDGLNVSPSLCHGVVRLLPKVPGVPVASQLRPITLLGTNYKLLTQMTASYLYCHLF